jgi:hypothetical protein
VTDDGGSEGSELEPRISQLARMNAALVWAKRNKSKELCFQSVGRFSRIAWRSVESSAMVAEISIVGYHVD